MPKGLQGFQKGNRYGGSLTRKQLDVSRENNPFWGKHHSEETKKKHSEYMKGRRTGELHPNWKGGITPKYWADKVKERDNWTCQTCGFYDPRIVQADHIKSKSIFPELKHDINNGITLCPNCHSIKTYEDKLLTQHKSNLTKKQWKRRKKTTLQ